MKTLLKFVLSFLMIINIICIDAQDIKKFPRIRLLLMEAQLSEIKKNIVIEDKNIFRFDQLYREYIREVSDLNSLNQGPALMDSNLEGLSDQEVEVLFINQTDRSKRLLILREKYFYEFKSIMKPRDIVQMYKIEREIMKKVQQEIRKREANKQVR